MLAIDKSIAANIELNKPWIEALDTKANANFRTKPLITRENNPKVKSVSGKDNNFIIGFTSRFKRPKITVSISKDPKDPMYTDDINLSTINRDRAFTIKKDENLFVKDFSSIFSPPYTYNIYYTMKFKILMILIMIY